MFLCQCCDNLEYRIIESLLYNSKFIIMMIKLIWNRNKKNWKYKFNTSDQVKYNTEKKTISINWYSHFNHGKSLKIVKQMKNQIQQSVFLVKYNQILNWSDKSIKIDRSIDQWPIFSKNDQFFFHTIWSIKDCPK